MVNYQKPIKDIKQEIGMALIHKYPPDIIDDLTDEHIYSSQKIHYYFAGIKVEIVGNIFRVMDTSEDFNIYHEIRNRLLLALLLEYIKKENITPIVENIKRRYRK
jgi:hypothetical protein